MARLGPLVDTRLHQVVPQIRQAAAPGNRTAARNPVVQAIVQQARLAGVDPALMVAVAMEESGLNPRATGDQGTSFGLYQLHQGGALGRLSAEQAYSPATNAGVIARSIAAAGGQGWKADASGFTNYYRQVGRGSSVEGPTNKALALMPQVQPLLGGGAPPVSAAGAPTASAGLDPRLLAGLQRYATTSGQAAMAGRDPGDLPSGLLSALTKAAVAPRLPAIGAGPGQQPAERTSTVGAIPAPTPGMDYPLGKHAKLIGTPYSGTHTLGNWESDNAVDLATPVGTPVVATSDGVIGSQIGALASKSSRMAGLRVHVDGPEDSFYYAHLSRLADGIVPGVHVKAGQVIGYSGSANGVAHLHFASRKRDPRAYTGPGG